MRYYSETLEALTLKKGAQVKINGKSYVSEKPIDNLKQILINR